MSQARHQERLMSILQAPHLSEKSTLAMEKHNQVVFRVRTDATKEEIRKAVELLFEVTVENVRVVNCRGKLKRHGLQWGQRVQWKKAYVTLAEGSHIEFLGME